MRLSEKKTPLVLALISICLWASFASISSKLADIPLYFLVGVTLGIGALPALRSFKIWWQHPGILCFGTCSIFGYHYLLFEAFRHAPLVEANLLNYLWPIFMILLSPLVLPNHSLRPAHIGAGLLAFVGAACVIAGNRLTFQQEYWRGYTLAIAAAISWAAYSVITKRLQPFSTKMVGGFCFCSSLLSFCLHYSKESTPSLNTHHWAWMFFLGIGPMGGAFYSWDAALKHGDPRVIGALSYLIPVFSTMLLALTGTSQGISYLHILALVLILAAALISSYTRSSTVS